MTPQSAIDAGADYLVVGRPITRAADPRAAADAIVAEIATALDASSPTRASIDRASVSASPSIMICLMRDLPPCATRHGGRRHLQPMGDQLLKRCIGAAVLGHGTHPRLQHRLAAEFLDAGDRVAR